jgi:hypothetical protein
MKNINSILIKNIIILTSLFIIISCNTDEKVYNNYQKRVNNIYTLSQSFKNTENDYLKTLIDSSKIVKNDINQLDIKLELKKTLIDSIQKLEESLKNKISLNCIIGKTLSVFIKDKKDDRSWIKFICEIKKNNKCTINTKVYLDHFGNLEESPWYFEYFIDPEFGSQQLREIVVKGEFQSTYKQINENTFVINIPNLPLTINIKDLNDCECELIKL